LTIEEAEEAQKKKELAAKKAVEDEERRKKLDEIARIQREKEAAAEAKLANAKLNSTAAPQQSAGKWKPSGSGGWRDRVAQKTSAATPPPPDSRQPKPVPSAFSSAFKKDSRDDRNQPPTAAIFGKPKIGSGKWTGQRDQQ
jgi:translation initiation factor 3 subunit A